MGVENFYIKKNDRLPYYKAVLRDLDGAIDLTGATVLATMQLISTGVNKFLSQAVNLSSDVTGGIEYRWAVGDTDTAGEYGIEFEVTTATGTFTVPKGFVAKVIVEDTYD